MSVDGPEATKMSLRILIVLLVVCCVASAQSDLETKAREFLEKFDTEATERIYQYSLASWEYNTNITKENSDKLVNLWRTLVYRLCSSLRLPGAYKNRSGASYCFA